jgi:hypothetical protein
MGAAVVVLFSGQDVDIAIKTANNAIDNNFLIATLPYLISAGLTAWAAYDVYDTYKTQGADAAMQQLVTMGVVTVATAGAGQLVYKLGAKVLGNTAKAAWQAYLSESPMLSKVIEKGAATFDKVKDKVKKSEAFKSAQKLDAKLDKAWEKGKEKVGERFGKTSTLPKVETQFDPTYWNKTVEFKGTKVYQRDDLIDPNFVGKDGRTNLQLMKEGLAPFGPDGKKLELHHMLQTTKGPIAETTKTFHRQNKSAIHINTQDIPSGIKRGSFDNWRQQYWIKRAKDFE